MFRSRKPFCFRRDGVDVSNVDEDVDDHLFDHKMRLFTRLPRETILRHSLALTISEPNAATPALPVIPLVTLDLFQV